MCVAEALGGWVGRPTIHHASRATTARAGPEAGRAMTTDLLRLTPEGLHCAAGDFWVDPWRPVPRAVVTHAHSDHARWGCDAYLASREGEHVLRTRLGDSARIRVEGWGEPVSINGVRVSLHPAGHILGSAQVRIEHRGEVVVVSGDYKTEPDPTCTPWEPVRCDTFVTESTFGLPIYRWPSQESVFEEVNRWWRGNAEAGRASLILGYSLGKAQRILAGLDPSIGPIFTHGAVEKLTDAYRLSGVDLPPTTHVSTVERGASWAGAMIVAPPSADATPWTRRFGALSNAFASGWMRIRGTRRRRALDRGFVLSDHVDWPSLIAAIDATGADDVWVTHGYSAQVVRWLRERGREARVLETRFTGERADGDDAPPEPDGTTEAGPDGAEDGGSDPGADRGSESAPDGGSDGEVRG
jgi:putative mRNA 3-end processing factor